MNHQTQQQVSTRPSIPATRAVVWRDLIDKLRQMTVGGQGALPVQFRRRQHVAVRIH